MQLQRMVKEAQDLSRQELLGLGLLGGSAVAGAVIPGIRHSWALHKMKKQMDLDKTPFDLHKGEIPEHMAVLRKPEDVAPWLKGNMSRHRFSPWERRDTQRELESLTKDKYNAAFIGALKRKGSPAVVLSDQFGEYGGKVLAHELGHYQDYNSLKAKDALDFHEKVQNRGGSLWRQIWDPTVNPTYMAEVAAWDNTPYGEGDPMREAALKTYMEGEAKGARHLAMALPMALAGYGLLAHADAKKEGLLMKLQGMVKNAFVGALIQQYIENDAPSYNTTGYNPTQWDRMIRKQEKKQRKGTPVKLDSAKYQKAMAKGVESLKGKVMAADPESEVDFSVDPSYAALGKHRTQGYNPNSLVTGHELGHLLDARTEDPEFFGDRGIFGIGGKAETMLKSESSATNHILKELQSEPPKTQQSAGASLASAFDTYHYSSRVNPEGAMIQFGYPDKEQASGSLFTKLRKGLGKLPTPENNYVFDDPIYNRILNKPFSERGSYGTPRYEGYQRIQHNRQRKLDENQILDLNKHKTNSKKVFAKNRQTLVKNIQNLEPHEKELLHTEINDYLDRTKKHFGDQAHAGVEHQVSFIRDALTPPAKIPTVKKPTAKIPSFIKEAPKSSQLKTMVGQAKDKLDSVKKPGDLIKRVGKTMKSIGDKFKRR